MHSWCSGPGRGGERWIRCTGCGEADESLPLVEIAAIGGLAPAEICHVVLHELAHVLTPGSGHGKAWRYAARQVGLLKPAGVAGSGRDGELGSDSARATAQAGDPEADRAGPSGILRLAPAAVWDGLWNARWHQPRRRSRQPLPEGGVPASRLWLPSAGDAQVAAAGRATLPDRRPRQPDAGRIAQGERRVHTRFPCATHGRYQKGG